jgi:8-oxo-dGTP pyrophosphatase MutT (NUDIX family)
MAFVATPPSWSNHARIADVVDLNKSRKILTLVYVLRRRKCDGAIRPADRFEVLLGHKARGFGEGRWNGFGGKFDSGVDASVAASAARELLEEAGIAIADAARTATAATSSVPPGGVPPASLRYDGLMFYQYEPHLQEKLFEVHVFSCRVDDDTVAAEGATPEDEHAVTPQPAHAPLSSEEMNPISWFTIPDVMAPEEAAAQLSSKDGFPKTPLVGAGQPALAATRPIPLLQMWPDDIYWLLRYLHRCCGMEEEAAHGGAMPKGVTQDSSPGPRLFVGAFAFKGYDEIIESHVEFAPVWWR